MRAEWCPVPPAKPRRAGIRGEAGGTTVSAGWELSAPARCAALEAQAPAFGERAGREDDPGDLAGQRSEQSSLRCERSGGAEAAVSGPKRCRGSPAGGEPLPQARV